MDFLTAQLRVEHSRPQMLRIVAWIDHDPERLKALIDIFLADDYRLTQRAAWALQHLGQQSPALLEPWLPQLVAALRRRPIHDAVKRNVIRLFEDMDVSPALQDELADLCFGYLADPQEAVAIRCFAMTVLEKICRTEPELKSELRLLLEEHLPHGTAAFKNRGGKLLKRL